MTNPGMQEPFDFNKVGKRMPYTVPDSFFDQMEVNIMKEIVSAPTRAEQSHATKGRTRWIVSTLMAVAAMALVVVLFHRTSSPSPAPGLGEVATAYHNLCEEDRNYLMEVYQDDPFLNDNTFE